MTYRNSAKLEICEIALCMFKVCENKAICYCGCKNNEFDNSDTNVYVYKCKSCGNDFAFKAFLSIIKKKSTMRTRQKIRNEIYDAFK